MHCNQGISSLISSFVIKVVPFGFDDAVAALYAVDMTGSSVSLALEARLTSWLENV